MMIESIKIKENKLTGYINLPFSNKKILVHLNSEKEGENLVYEDFIDLLNQLELTIKKIDSNKMNSIIDFISTEITDSSYSQSNYKPTSEDYQELKKELEVSHIDFYESDLLFFFKAENSYPKMTISIQLEEDLEVSEAEVIIQ
ncbi:hypothetical protein H0I23_00910 [Cellulophaga sp. HaHaR_3_176]|uniref:hypothetical protein n=1 Tax=Cellulophaga sp. HaHaR_3_176 TaxID=1942464 RepID=UPI001C1FCF23|nr:hypothetical protein [Cellulophaga sp. HaHaR_3_176]QWX84243.1 hypothetical protein H0I23_00910 [Cellulophaga sp. HaHaR_3_176]